GGTHPTASVRRVASTPPDATPPQRGQDTMADTTQRTGSAGLPPGNVQAANTYNPTAGASAAHPDRTSFPPGTPVVQSLSADRTVTPGRAIVASTASTTGLAALPGAASLPRLHHFAGMHDLDTEQRY